MESTQTKLVVTSVKNGVMTFELTFDPGNCYTHEMMRQIDEAILQARFDDKVHVVVIRGSGDKFFCAGADITCSRRRIPRSSTTSACTRTRRSTVSSRRPSW
jgi:enoyl-CoA hydratase/carnithine racemase